MKDTTDQFSRVTEKAPLLIITMTDQGALPPFNVVGNRNRTLLVTEGLTGTATAYLAVVFTSDFSTRFPLMRAWKQGVVSLRLEIYESGVLTIKDLRSMRTMMMSPIAINEDYGIIIYYNTPFLGELYSAGDKWGSIDHSLDWSGIWT